MLIQCDRNRKNMHEETFDELLKTYSIYSTYVAMCNHRF